MALTAAEIAAIVEAQLKLTGQAFPLTGLGFLNAPDTLTSVWDAIHSIFDNFIGLFSDLSQIIHLFDFLPGPWVTLFLIILAIVVCLRIYAWFADIQVGGFKI